MDKLDIIREVGHRTEYRQSDIEEVFDATVATIIDTLKRGEDVYLRPLGKFRVVARPARKRFIPNVQKHLYSVPKYAVTFIPSVSVKQAMVEKYNQEFPEDAARGGTECDA